eukprot:NODE_57_length_28844_cov_0.352687.p13 type:complete len:274 gc:universal NODE_57_length_28844_cov_0.352687:24859-25680(+)
MTWLKTLTAAAIKKCDVEEEFVLMLLTSFVSLEPILILCSDSNYIESTIECFADFYTLDASNCLLSHIVDLLSQYNPGFVLITNLDRAPEKLQAYISFIINNVPIPYRSEPLSFKKPRFVFSADPDRITAIEISLLSDIPLCYIYQKQFIPLEPDELLSRNFLENLSVKIDHVYLSPHMNILIHKFISNCIDCENVENYLGSKKQFIKVLKALAVILDKDFITENLILAICEKAMLHKLVYVDEVPICLPVEKRSHIEKRKRIIIETAKSLIP